jgi:hypothetical protein
MAQLPVLSVAGVNRAIKLRARNDHRLKETCMETAPTLILYAYTGKWDLGDDRGADRTVPDYFYEDKEAARRDMLGLHAKLDTEPDNDYPPSAWRGSKPSP